MMGVINDLVFRFLVIGLGCALGGLGEKESNLTSKFSRKNEEKG
jgi:hypothetical protein